MSKKEDLEVIQESFVLYKQGFLDGYMSQHKRADPLKAWLKIKDTCFKMLKRRIDNAVAKKTNDN